MYSQTVWQHARSPSNRGDLQNCNARGKSHFRKCGDDFELQLEVVGGRIVAARFQARACAPVIAMGSVGTQLLVGKTVEEALQLLPTRLDQALGGLPVPKRHAILLFIEALHEALTDFKLHLRSVP